MNLRVTQAGPPVMAPVSEHSLYSSVSSAKSIASVVSISDELASFGTSACREVTLCGTWRRLADKAGSLGEKPSDPSFDDLGWPQVGVPDNYGLEGELQRFYGPVWYRRSLRAGKCEYADLLFEGVDYLADVWLDGENLGHHEGYFAPFSFDVSSLLREKNVLAVRVQDPLENLDPKALVMHQFKKYIKGTMNYHDSRPGGLPGSTSPMWTPQWGQSLTTGGITQPVLVKVTGPVRIDAIFITPLSTDGQVHIALVLTNRQSRVIRSAFNIRVDSPKETLRGESDTESTAGSSVELELPPGPCRVDFDMQIAKPVLWWPCSHEKLGSPALYTLKVEAVCKGALSDLSERQFGIRTVSLTRSPWVFGLNGRSIFIKASNYIPRQHFAGVDKSFYDRDMRLLRNANLNSVGIHAHIQCPACYAATDSAGILVFQDFALQWSYDSCEKTNPGFRDRVRWQIAEMAYHLYNHPSVVYWACHNEPPIMFTPNKPADPIEDRTNMVLDGLLEARLKSVDPSRPVIAASGLGGISGDVHIYDGSIGGGSIYNCRMHKEAGFVSEYGFWSVAHTADKWGDTGWPPDKQQLIEWSGRLSFFGSTSTFVGAPKYYPDRQSWVHATQLYAAFLAKYQTEFFRVNRGQPYMGIRWHFFVDWWGYAGAGLLDVDRLPKMPYYWLAAAQRVVLMVADLDNTVFAPRTNLRMPILILNDSISDISGSFKLELYKTGKSIVIGGDPNGAMLGATMMPSKLGHMVALPATTPKAKVFEDCGIFQVSPESVQFLKTLQFETPEENEAPASYTLVMKWRINGGSCHKEDINWAHFLVVPGNWKARPGLQIV